MRPTPMNPLFNHATNLIASRILPLGFDICHSAPNRMDDLHTSMNYLGRMAIWDGEREDTCFADTETWRQFRAWHDWVHYRFDCAFSLPGEHKALHIQAGQLMRCYGRADDAISMIALMFCNIIGPLEAAAAGQAKVSGREFCEANWESWLPYARALVAEQGPTDVDAIAFAETAHDLRNRVGPRVPKPIQPAV